MAEFNHLQGPQADFSQGPDLYQRCLDWREECELLLNGPLAGKSAAVKSNYVMIWAGKTGRTHIKSLNLTEEQRASPATLLQKLEDWTKPRSNELAAAARFRELQQGNLSLAEYIDKATIMCDQCGYPEEARDRLLRDAIVIGLRSREAYYKCIERGTDLTLAQAQQIAESAEATENQVGYMRPEFRTTTEREAVHKIQKGGGGRPKQLKSPANQKHQGQSKRKSCFNCGKEPSHPKSECPARKAKCHKCGKEGHYSAVCRSKGTKVHKVETEEAAQHHYSDPYQPVYFTTDVNHIQSVTVKSLNNPKHEPHIRPLWLSEGPEAQVFKIDCEVDTGAGCNILPLYKAKALFGNIRLDPPTVGINGYGDSPVENLGSCTVYMFHGRQKYRVRCEVVDSRGYLILGREQAMQMKYVLFPGIQPPQVEAKAETTIKKLSSQPPQTKQQASSITLSGKKHPSPLTKDYVLKEYADVFEGIGTLPGGPYHIQLKEGYTPVQHPPRQVPVKLRPAYKAELDRLMKLNVIAEVKEHTEWINSIVPAKKPNGSIRLCLDPKDLNKAIKRNQWYSRTVDDILPELAGAKFFSKNDAKTGYWHVPLDLESSKLTTFNTPWGKFR